MGVGTGDGSVRFDFFFRGAMISDILMSNKSPVTVSVAMSGVFLLYYFGNCTTTSLKLQASKRAIASASASYKQQVAKAPQQNNSQLSWFCVPSSVFYNGNVNGHINGKFRLGDLQRLIEISNYIIRGTFSKKFTFDFKDALKRHGSACRNPEDYSSRCTSSTVGHLGIPNATLTWKLKMI